MTDSVVSAVQDAAQRATEQAEVIRLSLADQECFAQTLLSPPKPAPALERAFAHRSKLLCSDDPHNVPISQPAVALTRLSPAFPAPRALDRARTGRMSSG